MLKGVHVGNPFENFVVADTSSQPAWPNGRMI